MALRAGAGRSCAGAGRAVVVASQAKSVLIVLNGTSSAGKTTLATSLQARCSTPLQVSGVDTFLALQPESMFAPPGSVTPTEGFTFCAVEVDGLPAWTVRPGTAGEALMRAVHAYWAACAAEGIPQIIDHVLLSEGMALDLRDRLSPYDPLLVGVRCPLGVVDQRERERGDRLVGQGRGIGARVHDHLTYDVQVDTSLLSPDEAADVVLAAARARWPSCRLRRRPSSPQRPSSPRHAHAPAWPAEDERRPAGADTRPGAST